MPKHVTKWTHIGETSTLKIKVIVFSSWSSSLFTRFIFNEYLLQLSSKVSLSRSRLNFSKRLHIWLKSVSRMAELGSFPSWYQKVGFLVASQMGSPETPYCDAMGVSPRKGSPINFDYWIIPVSSSVFFFLSCPACHYHEM